MGSQSDWKTLVNTEETLEHLRSYEKNYFLHTEHLKDSTIIQKI